jgi:HEAT repeat protein
VRKLAEPSHAPILAEVMDSQDDLVRLAAVETLGRLRSLEGVPALCAAVEDGSPGVRCAAVRALGEIGDVRALDELIGALGGDPMLRREAAEALGHMGHPSAAGPLCAVLLDRDGQLQLRASEALERLGPVAAQSVCAMLAEPDRMVFWTIIRLGPPTIPYLVDGLQDHRDRVRRMAALALGELSVRCPVPDLRTAIPALKRGIHRFVLPPDDLGRIFRVALERIEQATAQSSVLPLPASAPTPWPDQLPLPAFPSASPKETLPIPGISEEHR